MTTADFISEVFYRGDESRKDVPKHPQASLRPREVVTLDLLFALQGVGNRAFYRWVSRDWLGLLPAVPDRTRLFRLFATHQPWTDAFLATPAVLGVVEPLAIRSGSGRASVHDDDPLCSIRAVASVRGWPWSPAV